MTIHRSLFIFAPLSFLVAVAACGGQSGGEPNGSDPSSLGSGGTDDHDNSSCGKQKHELSEMYCGRDQELWACSDGSPGEDCTPATASSNSFCCAMDACGKAAAHVRQTIDIECEPPGGIYPKGLAIAELKCTEANENYLGCLVGCADKYDCNGDQQWNCFQACTP